MSHIYETYIAHIYYAMSSQCLSVFFLFFCYSVTCSFVVPLSSSKNCPSGFFSASLSREQFLSLPGNWLSQEIMFFAQSSNGWRGSSFGLFTSEKERKKSFQFKVWEFCSHCKKKHFKMHQININFMMWLPHTTWVNMLPTISNVFNRCIWCTTTGNFVITLLLLCYYL